MIAADVDMLTIPESVFATSMVTLEVGPAHAQLGLNLGVRLVNLNVIPTGFVQATSPDLEVDFDDVRLSAVPEASPLPLSAIPCLGLAALRRRRMQSHASPPAAVRCD